MAQLVEHILGKDEVTGSTPVSSSTILRLALRIFYYLKQKITYYKLLNIIIF